MYRQAVGLEAAKLLRIGHAADLPGLPAELSLHEFAGCKASVIGGDHLGNAPAVDQVANLEGRFARSAALHHVHAHDRGDVKQVRFQQHLAGAGVRNRDFAILEVLRFERGDRMFRNHPLPIWPAPVVRFRHDIQARFE